MKDYGINGYRTTSKPITGVIVRPEGFIVNEVPGDYGLGDQTHFTLKKTNWNTIDAIKEIAKRLYVNAGRFSYAGLKDKNAITTQRVSAFKVPAGKLKALSINGLELTDFTEGKERISLGSHKGNEFIITISNVLNAGEFKEFSRQAAKGLPNFFGPQRFGNNHLIGRALIEGDYRTACELSHEQKINNYLKKKPGDYINALRIVDKRIRLLWVNALQAYDWNKELSKNIISPPESIKIKSYPMIPEMPELHDFAGGLRKSLMIPKGLTGELFNDSLRIKFSLEKGSYATILLMELMKE